MVCRSDRAVLSELREDPKLFGQALSVLKAAGSPDALTCLALSAALLKDERDKAQLLHQTLDLDLHGPHAWLASADIVRQRIALNDTVVAAIASKADERLELFRRIKRIEMDALLADGSPPSITSLMARVRDGRNEKTLPPADRGQGARFSMLHPIGRTLQSLAFHAPDLCEDIVRAFGHDPDRAVATLHNLRGSVPVYLLFSEHSYPGDGGESFSTTPVVSCASSGSGAFGSVSAMERPSISRIARPSRPFSRTSRSRGGQHPKRSNGRSSNSSRT
jgi:hypothetical protein